MEMECVSLIGLLNYNNNKVYWPRDNYNTIGMVYI